MEQTIIITGFTQSYVKDKNGVAQPVDIVTWVPRHAPLAMKNSERVDRLNPDNLRYSANTEQADDKRAHMMVIWSQIQPAYEAWKSGREVPLNGTPLAVWPGITPEQAEVFRLAGVRTVEDVRDMSETIRSRINLPNTRELKDLARIYLENSGSAAAAEREAAKDRQIETMSAEMAEMRKMLESLTAPAANPAPTPTADVGTADPEVLALRAQLDERGIAYHHRAGPEKLRELLVTGGASSSQAA